MKKEIFLGLGFVFALVVLGTACSQTANNGNTAINQNAASNHNSNRTNSNNQMNHNEMSHSEMKSDPNAASAPFDLQFIDTMSLHHQGAVEMAEMALKKSDSDELKKFAQKIIDDQKREIARMKEWREKWFAGKPAAKNMEMPGMSDSMKMMDGGMKKMEAAAGKDFDVQFLEMMIPHHEGAVAMSKDALNKAEHAEIKTLANSIIKSQEAEIKQMTDWKTKWAK